MAEKTPEHLHGVSLRHYATMTAGLADGIPRDELLAHLQLDAVRWERAERLWNEHILDELEAGRSLSESLDALVAEARASFVRPIPPLDAELRAWLDVQRAYALESDPLAFLERMGLRPSDMARLQSLWAARMKEEPSLRSEALRILSEPPGPPRAPKPEPARIAGARPLPPPPAGADADPEETMFVVAQPSREHLPFSSASSASGPLPPPPLSVPLPEPPRPAVGLGVTSLDVGPAAAQPLPFVAPAPPTAALASAAPSSAAPASAAPVAAPVPSDTLRSPAPAAPAPAPAPPPTASAAPNPLMITAASSSASAGPALPFRGADEVSSSRAFKQAMAYAQAAQEQGERAPKLKAVGQETAPLGADPFGPALPFGGAEPAPRAPAPNPLRETSLALDVPRGAALPFGAAPAAPAPSPPGPAKTSGLPDLTIKQYASLCVELVHEPERAKAILQRYGLHGDQLDALDAEWQLRLATPDTLVHFNKAYAEYQAWYLKAKEGR